LTGEDANDERRLWRLMCICLVFADARFPAPNDTHIDALVHDKRAPIDHLDALLGCARLVDGTRARIGHPSFKHVASAMHYYMVARPWWSGANTVGRSYYGWAPLHVAVAVGFVRPDSEQLACRLLARADILPNANDRVRMTPLDMAHTIFLNAPPVINTSAVDNVRALLGHRRAHAAAARWPLGEAVMTIYSNVSSLHSRYPISQPFAEVEKTRAKCAPEHFIRDYNFEMFAISRLFCLLLGCGRARGTWWATSRARLEHAAESGIEPCICRSAVSRSTD